MSQQPSPEKIKSAIASLIIQEDVLLKESEEAFIRWKNNNNAILSLFDAYKALTGKDPDIDPKLIESIRLGKMTNMKLSDAVYSILKIARKALTKDELIKKLRDGNARLSIKTPKNVINTMLKNDAGKFFKILKDGKIDLVRR